MSEHTKGELRLIRSSKHPGDIFVKIKGTERKFLCKFYGGGGTEISPSEAEDNVAHFIKCWNAFEEGGIVDELRIACAKGLGALEAVLNFAKNSGMDVKNETVLKADIDSIKAALAKC